MLLSVNSFFQILVITIGTFMIERYVLLEPAMEEKKQQLFYLIAFSAVIASFFIIGENAQFLALVFGGLNIFLGRKKRRFLGFFMVIPLIGIMNGFASPIFLIPDLLNVEETSDAAQVGIFAVYIIVFFLLLLFYFGGKGWRKWFRTNMKERKLNLSEYILIWISGAIMMLASNSFSIRFSSEGTKDFSDAAMRMVRFQHGLYEIISFMLTVTIIVLIMQGNKRAFYHAKVSDMQFNIIATMADIVENRDENTGGHIKRTAQYVQIIAKKLQSKNAFPDILTSDYLSDMVVAAPLHDIGKIHIPDAILNKPGRLTEEEYEVIKTHTTAGRDVLLKAQSQLGEFDYLHTAVEMAEYHHEWWNGKGYPHGLSGEDIPLCARVMAVADVFDALTAKRCYKDAMPLEKAFRIISEESGTHFDPTVAEAFLSCSDEIEKIFHK